ncbi:MAG: DUF1146 domain-containing protein [Solobacterium sp.]|jgi:uncharacterized membrane protein YwzB|nr:DUF1146 domain-containing protein [Solobacterium sp.]
MESAVYAVRAAIYIAAFMLSFYALGALNFSRYIKQGHVLQARILYWILVLSLAYLSGSFVLALIYR